MSVQAPEAAPAPAPPPQKENVFTRRIGPLPMWAWVAIVGGGVLAWSFFKKKKGGGLFGGGKSGKHTQEGSGGKPQAFLVPPYVGVWTYQAFPPENQPPKKGEPTKRFDRTRSRRGEDNENLEPEVVQQPQPGHGRPVKPRVPAFTPGAPGPAPFNQ